MTRERLLDARSVTKRFGGFVALDEVSLDVGRGERFGLIGPNGSGKTTVINCISGTLANDGGEIVFKGGCSTAGSRTSGPGSASRDRSRSRSRSGR